MVGAAAAMTLAFLLGPLVGINGPWQGTIAIVLAIVVGIVVGQYVGRLLFRPSSGGPPDHPPHA
jgi:hypothetical protein